MAKTIGGDYPYQKHDEIKKLVGKRLGGTVGGGFSAPRRMTARPASPVTGTTRAAAKEPLRRARTIGGY